ncbi:MAG: DUF4870 domain-containing protein [Phycisphaerales bacterium]|nr:DUF4870 domain-containing protein [Phycisphaerales bacterium]
MRCASCADRPQCCGSQFLVLLHLSQFAGLIVPLAGIALPIVLWQVNLAKPGVAAHGKEIANWIIFSFAVFFVCAAFFVVTTFAGAICPCMFIFAITWLLYPLISAGYIVCVIVGAVKASKGELFRYPMPVRLLK